MSKSNFYFLAVQKESLKKMSQSLYLKENKTNVTNPTSNRIGFMQPNCNNHCSTPLGGEANALCFVTRLSLEVCS